MSLTEERKSKKRRRSFVDPSTSPTPHVPRAESERKRKIDDFTVHTLALQNEALEDKEAELEFPFIDEYVQEYGLRIFAPENISLLSTLVPPHRSCAALLLAFRKLILTEHEVAKTLQTILDIPCVNNWGRLSDDCDSPSSGPTPLAEKLLAQCLACNAKAPISPVPLQVMMNDLHKMDRNIFIKKPQEVDKRPAYPGTTPKAKMKFLEKQKLIAARFPGATRTVQPVIIVAMNSDYEYIGHIYASPNYLRGNDANVIGIRTSMVNLVCQTTRNVAVKIFYGVTEWAIHVGLDYVSVDAPLENMKKILRAKLMPEVKHWWTENVYALRERIAALGERGTFTYYGCGYPVVELIHELRTSKEAKHDIRSLVREWKKIGATKENIETFLELLIRSMTYDESHISSLSWSISHNQDKRFPLDW